MNNFKTIVENYIQDMEVVEPSGWEGVVTAGDFLANFDRSAEALEYSLTQMLNYGAGKFPKETKVMWACDTLEEMAQHIRDNWEKG